MTDKVYEFLTAPRRTAAEILKKKRERAERLSAVSGAAIRYDVPKVQKVSAERLSGAVIAAVELSDELEMLEERIRAERRQIAEAAIMLENVDAGRVVILRYLDELRWEDIAKAIHKSKSTVFRLQNQATDELDRILCVNSEKG